MRFVWLVVALGLIGCDGPSPAACSIGCDPDDPCPDGTTCSAGFCAAEGKTCEPTFQRVVAGTGVACAVDQFKRWWCWGSNEHNEIDESSKSAHPKVVLSGQRRWETLSIGAGHACGVDEGELWCWGRNDRNQVTGRIVGDVAREVRVEVPGQLVVWTAVSAGNDYTCGIGDGKLFCWGSNEVGKLGNGTVDDASQPQAVQTELLDWVAVAAGGRHTCALSTSSGLFCWGDGSSGQLGNSRFNVRGVPQSVGLAGVTQVAVGLDSTCAITDVGQLWCWGRSFAGALGDPAIVDPEGENQSAPVLASDLDGWSEVTLAEKYGCARREDEVWCWGSALAGGIGEGRWQSTRAWHRVLIGAASVGVGWNATSSDLFVDAGDYDLSCAVVGGGVQCWGDNRSAQLAQGKGTSSEVPSLIVGDRVWTSLVAGDSHVCGLGSTGDVYCWGSTEHGQVNGVEVGRQEPCHPKLPCDSGIPIPVIAGATQLALGGDHTCALTGEGVVCWGANSAGQCGAAPSFAVLPTTVTCAWTAVHAGAAGTCTNSATETWCWGAAIASSGTPMHEPALDGAQTIALAQSFGCALMATGSLACFGEGDSVFGNGGEGTCGDQACNAGETVATCEIDCGPAPLTHLDRTYTTLATGTRPFTCALRTDGKVECWGDNFSGQCGQTVDVGFGPELVHPVTVPFEIETLAGCTRLAVGGEHACAVCNGSLRCWGDASHGELGPPTTGDPVTIPRTIPPPLDGTDLWADVTAGDAFTCARTARGRGFCWGRSLHGALGNGATGSALPIAVTR